MGRADRSSTKGDPRDNRRGGIGWGALRHPRFAKLGPAGRAVVAATAEAEAAAGPDVLTVATDAPILAHRYAKLKVSDRGRGLSIWSVNQSCEIQPVQDAVCRRNYLFTGGIVSASFVWSTTGPASMSDLEALEAPRHAAPDPNCHCGFYAVPLDERIPHYDAVAELIVELSGTVVESERPDGTGSIFRAGRQRVLEVRLPRCPFCGRPAAVAHVDASSMEIKTVDCGNHRLAYPGMAIIMVEALQRMCPVRLVAVND